MVGPYVVRIGVGGCMHGPMGACALGGRIVGCTCPVHVDVPMCVHVALPGFIGLARLGVAQAVHAVYSSIHTNHLPTDHGRPTHALRPDSPN